MATLNGVPFRKMLVPESKWGIKCGFPMIAKKITIHNTDNQMPAEREITYMRNNNNMTSYHYASDEREIIQGLPLERNGWHSGDGRNGYGNRNTIGWEMCRNYDRVRLTTNLVEPLKSQFEETVQVTIKGVAQVALDNNIIPNFSTIKQHKDWSGKHCPSKLLNDGQWNYLVNEIIKEYNRLTTKPSAPKPSVSKGQRGVATVTADTLTLRYAPSVNSATIRTLSKGEAYKVWDEKDGWLRLGTDKWASWQNGAYMDWTEKPTKAPTPKPKPKPVYKTKFPLESTPLRYAMVGTGVTKLQNALNAIYFNVGRADGSYGPAVVDAVRRFQSVYLPHEVDGHFGPATNAKLVEVLKEKGL